jgi:steroid delta-isomerase
MPTPEDIRQVFDQYISGLVRRDLDAVVAVFAPGAVLHDPVDGPMRQGIEAIRAYFAEGIDVMRACRLTSPVHISADCRHAAIAAHSEAEVDGGMTVFDTIDVMTFDEGGKISTMTTYWGPTNVRRAEP